MLKMEEKLQTECANDRMGRRKDASTEHIRERREVQCLLDKKRRKGLWRPEAVESFGATIFVSVKRGEL